MGKVLQLLNRWLGLRPYSGDRFRPDANGPRGNGFFIFRTTVKSVLIETDSLRITMVPWPTFDQERLIRPCLQRNLTSCRSMVSSSLGFRCGNEVLREWSRGTVKQNHVLPVARGVPQSVFESTRSTGSKGLYEPSVSHLELCTLTSFSILSRKDQALVQYCRAKSLEKRKTPFILGFRNLW
jgi:hypothetical protein